MSVAHSEKTKVSDRIFNVVALYSGVRLRFDPCNYLEYYGLHRDRNVFDNIDDFMVFVCADVNPSNFRSRKLPLGHGLKHSRPMRRNACDGVIVDINVWRHERSDILSEISSATAIGVVSWAVMHSIPVGLVYDTTLKGTSKNFGLESTLETLESHPKCKGGKIPSGTIETVCVQMKELLIHHAAVL